MLVSSINSICTNLSPLIQIIGYFVLLFKIFLPLILIVIITVDLAKIIVSNKSDEIKKFLKSFVIKLSLCIIVYFVPMIVMIIMSFVEQFEKVKTESGMDYNICQSCMFDPDSEICSQAVAEAEYK